MAVFLSPVGGVAAQFFTNNGVPLSGGKLYTYAAGTTTPAATYTSSSGGTAHANPIVLDSGGRVPGGEIWLTDGTSYKFLLKDSTDVLIATYDNIVGINSNFVNFFAEEEIQVATAGQTVFTLSNPYVPGGNTLSVFVDGVNQYNGTTYSYVETSASTVTFYSGLHVGALVKFTTVQSLTSGQQTDAALVTYNEGGTGAVATTVRAKLQQTVSVKDFGAVGNGTTDDTAAFTKAVAALPTTGGVIEVPDATGYKITSTIVCTKPVLWKIGATTVTANLSGYLFNIQANNSGIEGTAGSILKAGTGCTALIFNNQTLNCHYWNLKLDLNNVVNLVGINHDGGWYVSVKNIWVDIAGEVASSYTLRVYSTYTGVPGPTGSYGGAYVSTYDNVIGGKVLIGATIPQLTTTLTFTGCSLSNVIASNSRALTFLQPIVQGGGNFFDLTNVAGLTCLGGDFEVTGAGQVYVFQGASNRDIVSMGNQTSGVTPSNYIVGNPSAGSMFMDMNITGAQDSMLRYGSLPEYALRNSGFSVVHRFGMPYAGDVLVAANNITLTSATTGNLDDTTKSGSAIYLDTSGQIKIMVASSGANPRTLTQYALFDGSGLKLYQLPSSAASAGTKGLWYDPADSNRVKFVP